MSLRRSLSLSLLLKRKVIKSRCTKKMGHHTKHVPDPILPPYAQRPARDPLLTLVHIFTLAKLDHFLPPSPKIVQTQNECLVPSGVYLTSAHTSLPCLHPYFSNSESYNFIIFNNRLRFTSAFKSAYAPAVFCLNALLL